MARSADGAGVSVSVEVLLPGVGSLVPPGTLTVAVFTRFVFAAGDAVPVTVKTTEFPAPAGTFIVADNLLPEPVPPAVTLVSLHDALPILTPVKIAEIVSATEAPVTLLKPLLVTV